MFPGEPCDHNQVAADWFLQMTDTINIRAGRLRVVGARMVERLLADWIEAHPVEANELALALRKGQFNEK